MTTVCDKTDANDRILRHFPTNWSIGAPLPMSPPVPRPPVNPTVVSIEMGYGHLRAAMPLAIALEAEVLHADRAPLANPDEQRRWARARGFYESLSRLSQVPMIGSALDSLLDAITAIPRLHPYRDLSAPTLGTRSLHRLILNGLGKGLGEHLRRTGSPLLTTFYAPAIAADHLGCPEIYCVVTDADINRIWAPMQPAGTRIHYFVPSLRAQRRLEAYGVPKQNIEFTGFPLPDELVGGPDLPLLRKQLAARLVRLDPQGSFRQTQGALLTSVLGPLPREEERRSPLLTFAIGGTGAQLGLAELLIASLKESVQQRKLRLALVAGVRADVAQQLEGFIERAGLANQIGSGIEILLEKDFASYFSRFNRLLAETDILWTKPSELTFYAALGIPLILASPVGVHEWSNRRWAREHGTGLKQRDAKYAASWLNEWICDGILAGVAWSGFMRLPKQGLYRILERFRGAVPVLLPAG